MSTGELPKGWVKAHFADVLEINPRDDLSQLPDDTPVSFIPMQAVEELSGMLDPSRVRPISEVKRGYTQFRAGDVLLAKITPCMENGKFAIAENLKNGRGFGSTEFHVVRCPEGMSNRYVLYYALRSSFRNSAAHNMKGTAGQKRIPTGWLEQVALPIPPTTEQERIVAKIDELFTRLDAAKMWLIKAKDLLKKYQETLFDAAIRGKLSKGGRTAKKCKITRENIASKKREAFLEAGLRQKKPAIAEDAAPSWLPDGWAWASLEEVSLRVTDGTHQPPRFSGTGIPFIVIQNIREGSIAWESVSKFVSDEEYVKHTRNFPPQYGDVLYTAVGSYGNAVEVLSHERFMFQRHIAHIRPIPAIIRPSYLALVLNSPFSKTRADKVARGVAQKTVTLGELARFPIPVPPIEEQDAIVKRCEDLLERKRDLAMANDGAARQLSLTEQSIFSAAFRGELVTQDSSDEPAEKLLERIRAERTAQGAPTKSRTCKQKATA